jgi:hypothetical protein
MKRKIKQLKKLCASQLPRLKRALLFINKHREVGFFLYLIIRVEQLHTKIDIFQDALFGFLIQFYSQVADSIELTQAVFMHFLRAMGVES